MPPTPKRRAAAPRLLSSTAEADGASAAQLRRRERIIEATLALASMGGYEAVQMRAVAERADVSLGTLYRYFPSKIHLLVTGLVQEFEQALRRLERGRIPGECPYERVLYVLGRMTRTLQRDPQLTEAMTRAFMFADTTAANEVDAVTDLAERFFTRAMTDGDACEEQRAIARVITDVWMSNLVSWVTRRSSASDMSDRLELTVRLLLGSRS